MVYCHVRGHNPVQPGGDLIVCNVVVSYVSAKSNHFPVVIFPPTSLPGYEDLENLLELGHNYDLVQLEDFEIPDDQDEDSYVRERLDAFNRYVMEYVELCREHIQEQISRQTPPERGQFRELPDLRPESERSESGNPEDDLRLLEGPVADRGNSPENPRPRARGRGIKIARFRGDEASALDFLESWVDRSADPDATTGGNSDELNRVLRFIASNYPRYDIHNFKRTLSRSQTELPRLYLQKFRAIYTEAYEQAAEIQSAIRQLEKKS